MDKCDINSGTCESSSGSSGECSSSSCKPECACGGCCGGDPVVCAMLIWKCAFKEAMREVMVDALKSRIQKTMGSRMDKSADAVMEAMLAKWQSKIATEEAKTALKDKLRKIMTEGK